MTDEGLKVVAGFTDLENLDLMHNAAVSDAGLAAMGDFPALTSSPCAG